MAELIINQDDLTIDDMEAIEEAFGKSFDELTAAKVTKGMIWLALKQQDPKATLADAGKVKVGDLGEALGPLPEDGKGDVSESSD
jgi:hypothetical protein